jgi:hypothetical protein
MVNIRGLHISFLMGLSTGSPPEWLLELHQKLWGKKDLLSELIRTVKLDDHDFTELKSQLKNLNSPNDGEAILATKSAFLRSKGGLSVEGPADSEGLTAPIVPTTSQIPLAHAMEVDAPIVSDQLTLPHSSANPAPSIVPEPFSDERAHSASFIDPGHVPTEVLEAPPMIFPCTIQYLDLTVLAMKRKPRVPTLMLIRSEWISMMEMIKERPRRMDGSAIVTGQPGIGQHHFLTLPLIF